MGIYSPRIGDQPASGWRNFKLNPVPKKSFGIKGNTHVFDLKNYPR